MATPQPFKEQPHVTALVRNSEFVHAHLGRNIDYLLSLLVRASVLTESKIIRIKKGKSEAERVERLLSFVKYYNFDRFIDFLEVLRDCFIEKADKDFWYCLKRLIDEVKDAPASELNLSPDYEQRFNDLKWFVTSEGFYYPVETALINKSNMMFYSSVHGVSITFQSLPVEEFEVSLTVLNSSLFKYSEEFELCTMMVDITTKPQFLKFATDSILVSIPHCAVVSCLSDAECLSVRTLQGPFQLNEKASIDFSTGEEIKADFGDGCCAHFNISHFTLFAGVKRRRYSGPPLNTREVRNPTAKRPNQLTNDFAFYRVAQDHLIWQFNQVRCCYPLRRSDDFRFVILCYMTLPSLERSVAMEAARICKCSERELMSHSFPISETCSSLLYTVDSSGLSDWKIKPMEKFLQIVSSLEKELFCCSRDKSSGFLNTVVDVKEMPSAEESTDYKFNIMSDGGSTRNQDLTTVCLQLHNDIFSSLSELRSFLTRYLYTPQLSSIYLLDVTSCNEHYQFLAYLSYHMGTKWRMIGQCLKIDEANLDTINANHSTNESSEKAFQMLLTWATSHNTPPLLKSLLDALTTCNYSIRINCSIDDSLVSAEEQVGHLQVPESILYEICHNSTITKWLFIGRFLGLENHQLERVLSDNTGVVERSYQMFLLWISSFGSSATYKCLVRAFFLVHQLDSTCVNAAWIKIKRHISMLRSTGQQIHVN